MHEQKSKLPFLFTLIYFYPHLFWTVMDFFQLLYTECWGGKKICIMTEHQSRQTVCKRNSSAKRKSVWYAEPVTDPWKAIASCGEIKHMIFESRDIVKFTYVRARCPSKRLFWSRHLTPEIIPSSVFWLDIPVMLCTVYLNCKSFSYSLFTRDPTMQVFWSVWLDIT